MSKQEIRLCKHVKTNGSICESPALQDRDLCFFHTSSRERIKRQRRAARKQLPFQLPLLEDAESIQLAIGDTLNALLAGQIDHKTAGLVLYGLQTATHNVRHTHFRTYESTRRYEHYHNLEEESLEQEIALEAEQEVAQEVAQAETADAEVATVSTSPARSSAASATPALPPKKSPESVVLEPAADESAQTGGPRRLE